MMTGPNAEDGYGAPVDDELDRILRSELAEIRAQADLVCGIHHDRGSVVATIVAHSDRGDGYCETCHEVDPCGTRRWHERVLERMRR
jgi:hypothetical protein